MARALHRASTLIMGDHSGTGYPIVNETGHFGKKGADGEKPTGPSLLEQKRIRRALSRRLEEKMQNYERAAARLELRGEDDASRLLVRAANRIRTLRRAC